MGSSLPPFGIRHLRDGEPFSVLQVNEQQYQSTVDAHPHAALSFIDEDDGEKVTVGSSFELKQRLEDPLTPSAPLIFCYNVDKNEFEDRLIHLFDIQKTSTCRSLWKEHRLVYNKSKKQYERALNDKHEHESISTIDLNSDGQDRDTPNSEAEDKNSHSRDQAHASSTEIKTVDLSGALPDLVDNLASLLQTTSDTLRKAAEKSRQSNTSPVEDVLAGVSSIVTEIGGFGLSLLDSLTEKTADSINESAGLAPSIVSPRSVTKDQAATTITNSNSPVSSLSSGHPTEAHIASRLGALEIQGSCNFCLTCKLECRKQPEPHIACHNCATLGYPCSFTSKAAPIASAKAKDDSASPVHEPAIAKDESLLDQDYTDADFSRRYPPLNFLQRAATFAAPRNPLAGSSEPKLVEHGLIRHNSWTRRYPLRPAPQILNDETHRRREFARNCFPAQQYTPGPGVVEQKSTSSPTSAGGIHAAPIKTDIRKPSNFIWHPPNPASIATIPTAHNNPQPQHSDVNSKHGNATTAAVLPSPSSRIEPPTSTKKTLLPGAWPDATEGQSHPSAPEGESSGAFFNRMMRDNLSRRQRHAPDTNERLTRHRSFVKQRLNPFTELNRSRTLNSNANPDSRLNRPFEPLYPVAAPTNLRFQNSELPSLRNQSDTTIHTEKKLAQNVSAQRAFSPVWEEHFNQMRFHHDKIGKLDRNGESSSMYSPPPRHMRSVPNFATFKMKTAGIRPGSSSTTGSVPPVVRPKSPAQAETVPPQNSSLPGVSDEVFYPAIATQPIQECEGAVPKTSPPDLSLQIPPSNPFETTAVYIPLPNQEPSNIASPSDIQACLSTLLDMGYGVGDDNLKSRLHIYAEAAGGDVTDAIDMIDEDRRAHFVQEVEVERSKQFKRHVRRARSPSQ